MKLQEVAAIEVTLDITLESNDRLKCVLKPVDRFFRNSLGYATALQTGTARKALEQYMKHKDKFTAQFFASTQEEKHLYSRIVKDLMASKHYKLKKSRGEGGVWIWELQRIREPNEN